MQLISRAQAGVMASRDANIACTAVEAIWCSVCHAASDTTKPTELMEGLRGAVRQCFEQRPRHAGYVRCLQSFALADRGGSVDVGHAAQAAQASGSLQAGALQVTLCTLHSALCTLHSALCTLHSACV